jgi:hypothetical protein
MAPLAHLAANRTSDTIAMYAMGFLDASVALFERAHDDCGPVDLAFYPAAYCMRHGVELLIKQLSIFAAYEMRDTGLLYEPGHSLAKAWEPIQAFVADVVRESAGDDLRHHVDVLTGTVDELHDLDERGTLLRYPEFVKNAKGSTPRLRVDTHVPFDDVNLTDWLAMAEATRVAAQLLYGELSGRASYLRMQRNHPPEPYEDLIKRG